MNKNKRKDNLTEFTNLQTYLHTNLQNRKKILAKHKLSRYKPRELKKHEIDIIHIFCLNPGRGL